MRKHIVVALSALILLCSSLVFAVGSQAGGSESGVYPDRVFQVTKSAKSSGDSLLSAQIIPSFDGEWWVDLQSLGGNSVVVVVKADYLIGNRLESSTDLRAVGSESKHTFLFAGSTYSVTFIYRGATGTSILREHFNPIIPVPPELPPFETAPHAPIVIQSDAEFLNPMSGVLGGAGTSEDPYVIEGWEISESTEIGIKLWYTSSHVVIRNCFVHSIGFPAHGIYLFFAANVVIENCYVESCIGSEIAIGFSHDIRLLDNVVWSDLYIYNSYDCELRGNHIHEAVTTFQYSSDLLLIGNTFSDSEWFGMWFVECYDTLVIHNNFVNNELNVWLYEGNGISWDEGSSKGGNFWSDYTGLDANSDGIGDTPYVIDSLNQDAYPLMAQV